MDTEPATPPRPTSGVEPRATPRAWLGLAVLALPTLVVAVNITVLFLGLPQLSADLGATGAQALWITDIYGFGVAGFLITMGTVGDRVGRRRLLLLGAAAFGVASLLAAYAPTAETLIAARALMGVAAATLMPSTLSLIRVLFRAPDQRTTAIAVWMTTMSVGLALGPLLGGLVLQYLWWGSLFLLNIPFILLLLVIGPALLPEYRNGSAGRVDPASVALSLGAILALVYALKELATGGVSAPAALAAVAGAGAAVVFVRRQRTLTAPLVDPQLFRSRAFTFALVMITLALVAFGGNQLLLSLYLQQVSGLSPWWAGVWMAPSAVALLVGSMLAPALARRLGPTATLGGSLTVGAVGFALLVALAADPTDGVAFVVVQVGVALAFLAIGPPTVLGADLVVGSAPPEKAGAASALEETAAELGVAVGIALLGSLSVAVYRQRVEDAVAAAPPEAAETARGGLDGALAVADQLGPELVAAARDAFTTGFAAAGGASAVLLAGLAVASVVVLRRRG